MLYRTILGMVLQMGQQLTGANFFFYYGTTVFSAVGLTDSYVTQIILNTVNVACTLASFWVIANVGRRKALMAGAAWSFMCFMIYSLVGHFVDPITNAASGNVLIVFSCFFSLRSLPLGDRLLGPSWLNCILHDTELSVWLWLQQAIGYSISSSRSLPSLSRETLDICTAWYLLDAALHCS